MQSEDTKLIVPKLISSDGFNWDIYRKRLVYNLSTHGLDIQLTGEISTAEYIVQGDVGGLTPEARWGKEERILSGASLMSSSTTSVPGRGKGSIGYPQARLRGPYPYVMSVVDLVQHFRTKKRTCMHSFPRALPSPRVTRRALENECIHYLFLHISEP